jgi:hypothetical protein
MTMSFNCDLQRQEKVVSLVSRIRSPLGFYLAEQFGVTLPQTEHNYLLDSEPGCLITEKKWRLFPA